VVIEDGPTLTHGSMPYGAGFVAAQALGAVVVDPWPSATLAVREILVQYPHIGPVLPAVGYSVVQLDALRATLDRVSADVVVSATPVDLARLIAVDKPVIRARYEFAEAGAPGLGDVVDDWLARL
jgi:predicted GTPase